MSAETVARSHQRYRARLLEAVAQLLTQAWSSVSVDDLDGTWSAVRGRALVAVTGAQLAAARVADDYLDEVLAAQRLNPAAAGRLASTALAGVASDGRALDTLLRQPVISAKVAIAAGRSGAEALASGAATLDMIGRTQVADAGRAGDLVAMAARRAAGGYVRMLSGGSCSRCIILAGKRYRWNHGFRRHPRCDCVHIPTGEDLAGDLRTNPQAYFRSLSTSEQDRAFGKANAEAIRAGADMSQVVNAQRGTYEATVGGRTVRATRESTSRQGTAAGQRLRLMPEEIIAASGGDRDEAVRLLRLNRYLI